MDSNPLRIHIENNSINGADYIEMVVSMDPRQLHNEICAAAENLRRRYGITDVSINPWFYLIPPKPRRDKSQIHGVTDLWKLYDASGEDTDSDEEDRGKVITVPENSCTTNNARTFKSSPSTSSAGTEVSKEEPTKKENNDLEVTANGVEASSVSQRKNKKPKKNKSLPSAKLMEKTLPALNCAKEREGKLHSFYGNKACHIKAKEDCLKVTKINCKDTCNSLYWPCEPLNHRYAFGKLQVQH